MKPITLVLLVFLLITPVLAQPRSWPSSLQPCKVAGVADSALCGTYAVYENRAASKGRKIDLYVVVLPATGSVNLRNDAVVLLAGGPGQGASRLASFAARVFASLRSTRDILLVDQRGTGQSNSLAIELAAGKDAQAFVGDLFPVDSIRAGRRQLESRADLTQYTTINAVDDVDEVRQWLGYSQINLYGGSYGSRFALVYMKRHPARVRTAVLKGVAPTTMAIPETFAPDSQHAMDLLIDDCLQDVNCRAAFPKLREELAAVLDRLEKNPAGATITHPLTGAKESVSLSRGSFAEALRNQMYAMQNSASIPVLIHAAFENNFDPIAQVAARRQAGVWSEASMGLYLSVTCGEDIPFLKSDAGRSSAGTFLGDYRVRQQTAACREWVRATVPRDVKQPVRSSAPTLIISGGADPVTPPANGAEVAKYLPNSLHVTIRNGSHGFDGLFGCVDRFVVDFIEKGTTAGVDVSCAGRIQRPPFVLKLP